jgi:hypothetical protein
MGPVTLARGLEGRAPYAVKIHGSALEYTVRPHCERFLPYAREGIVGASGVLVGSRHTAESLWEVFSDEPSLPERTRLAPPGVDVSSFRPRRDAEAAIGLTRLADKLASGEIVAWGAKLVLGPRAVEEIAAKLAAWLTLDDAERKHARFALAEEAARRYSWEKVAEGVIAAAQGRLNELCPLRPPATTLQSDLKTR